MISVSESDEAREQADVAELQAQHTRKRDRTFVGKVGEPWSRAR